MQSAAVPLRGEFIVKAIGSKSRQDDQFPLKLAPHLSGV